MTKGIIADIQRSSVHDGPGIRTTVFFKGCPLHCAWCHNPECIAFMPQLMLYPEHCIHCGKCDEGCFAGAKVICGKTMSVQEVMAQIKLDAPYYGETGGVTFSGGEALAQRDFLNALIDACREEGIPCAVETSLLIYDEEVFQKLDLCMADLKIWNSDLHEKYTGVSNNRIKENFIRLDKLGVPIIARTPVIPEIDQGIAEIASFMKELSNVKQYELLPYHPLGNAKRVALGLPEVPFSIPTAKQMEELKKYVFLR